MSKQATKSPKPTVEIETTATTAEPPKTKHAITIELLSREEGVTIKELMIATGWKNHSVRGHISNLRRKKKLNIKASLQSGGQRSYRIIQDVVAEPTAA